MTAPPDSGSGGPAALVRMLVVVAGLLCLVGAWILSCPVNSAPDEASHLTRGIATAGGHLRGVDAAADYRGRGLLQYSARRLSVPTRLAVADNEPCYAKKPDVPASCGPTMLATHQTTALSHVGGYFPLPYVPLGVAERATNDPDAAVYAGRVASGVLCIALLALAFSCLRTRWQRAGWLCVLTPITLWTAGTAATNGLEVSGAVCLIGGVLALAERRRLLGTTAWLAGATALGCAKAAGPAWLVAVLVLAGVATHGRGMVPRLRGWWRTLLLIPAVAVVGNLAWSVLYLTNPVSIPKLPVDTSLHTSYHQLVTEAVPQMFTRFGWLDTLIPAHLWLLGAGGVAVLVLVSFAVIGWSGRAAVLLAAAVFAAATFAFTFEEVRGRFGLQARYTAAMFVAVPLVAVLATSRRRREPPGAVVGVVVVLWAAAALIAGYYNLRRYAVGADGPLRLSHVLWSPPGGVRLTLILFVVGALLLAAVVSVPTREGGVRSRRGLAAD